MHQRVVVLDASLKQQLIGDAGELPPRRNIAGGATVRDTLDQVDAPVENRRLLLAAHCDRVFVAVAVDADLVAFVHDPPKLVREGLDGVAGHEPRGWQVVFFEQVEQPRHADLAGEHSPRNIVGRVLASV